MSVNIDYLCFVRTSWKMRSQNMNNGWFTCASKIVEISKQKSVETLVKNRIPWSFVQDLPFFDINLFSKGILWKDLDDISVRILSNKQQNALKIFGFVFKKTLFISQGTSKDLFSKTVLQNFFNFSWTKEHDTNLTIFKIEKNL